MVKAEMNADHANNREKENKKRHELLTMKPARIILKTALPLLAYSCVQIAFQFFDMLTVANISQGMVSTVLLVNDLQMVFNMIFVSISVAIGIRISYAFGAGNMEAVRHEISTVFFLTLFIVSAVVGICVPLSRTIMRLCAFPEDLLPQCAVYFSINIISLFFSALNSVYFATEKARGNTRLVSRCNLVSLIIKVALNALVLYLVRREILDLTLVVWFLPAASCIAQATVSVISLRGFFSRNSMFRVRWKDVTFTRTFFREFSKLSFPVLAERVLTSSAKVICNGLYAVFGSPGLAAFACCNRIVSLVTTPLSSFEDAETTVVAANLGACKYERTGQVFRKTAVLVLALSTILFVTVWLLSGVLISFFSKGDAALSEKIARIYTIERWDFVFVAIDCVCCGFLYAIKKTKLPTVVNFLKLFAVRIPLFLLLTRVYGMDLEAIAWSILLSNMFDAVMSVIFLIRGRRAFLQAARNETANDRLLNAVRALGRLDASDWHGAISVPDDLFLQMREAMGGSATEEEMAAAYRYALIEARITELEKTERIDE